MSEETANQTAPKYETMAEFWPFYLGEHADMTNRALHFTGSAIALVWLGTAIYTLNFWYLIPALLSGYAFAWVGHFFVEKNRPASFKHPLKSFAADWIMFSYILTGRINKEIQRLKDAGQWNPPSQAAATKEAKAPQ